jgi:hypothetical protein
VAKTIRTKIDWDSMPIVIDEDTEPNQSNPYAASTQEDRDKSLRDLVRTILLRRAKRVASN